MLGTSFAEAMAANRVMTDGQASATDFIGRRGIDHHDPQSFLVRAAGGHVIPAHFHAVDQFQIFVEGTAKLGRFDLQPGSIHYTDAFKDYGPIVAKEGGYGYFTLRPVSTTSYHVMPAEAQRLRAARASGVSPRRMLMGEFDPADTTAPGATPIFAEDDGVGAYRIAAGAGEPLAFPDGVDTRRFLLVTAGEVTASGRNYGPKSCLWAAEGEAFGRVIAGDEGAVGVLATFGRQAA